MRTRQRTATAVLIAVTTVAVLVGGCSQLTGPDDGRADSSAPVGATDVLHTVEWSVLSGMVSVVVRNDGDRALRRAAAVVTAVDDRGVTLASSVAQAARSDCCTVLDLPPASTYGLYFDTSVDPAAIADVVVRYRDVSWSTDPAADDVSVVPATAVELRRGTDQTVVVADVTPATAVAGATVQATLADPAGHLVGVVSGRWACFAGAITQRIEIELPHAVPEGTTVSSVQVLPIRPPNDAVPLVEDPEPGSDTCDDVS